MIALSAKAAELFFIGNLVFYSDDLLYVIDMSLSNCLPSICVCISLSWSDLLVWQTREQVSALSNADGLTRIYGFNTFQPIVKSHTIIGSNKNFYNFCNEQSNPNDCSQSSWHFKTIWRDNPHDTDVRTAAVVRLTLVWSVAEKIVASFLYENLQRFVELLISQHWANMFSYSTVHNPLPCDQTFWWSRRLVKADYFCQQTRSP